MLLKTHIVRGCFAAIFAGMFAVAVTGCKKEETDESAKFAGTWHGTGTCNGGTSTGGDLVFTATDKKTITTNYSVGSGSCAQGKTLTGTASGNNISFPTTTVSDGCGGSYGLSGSATLNGTSLTFTLSVNGAVNSTCTFTGTK